MKILVVCLLSLLSVVAAQTDGRYYHDDTGKYVHDPREGQYIHDDSGNYRHDGTGNYRHDGTGVYSGDQSGRFGSGGGFGGRFSGSKSSSQFGSKVGSQGQGQNQYQSNLIGAGTFQRPQKVSPVVNRPVARPSNQGFGGAASATSQYSQTAGGNSPDGRWRILRQSGDVELDGYRWEYLTENGINAEESGRLVNKGTDRESMEAQGFYTYTGPDGVVYTVRYTAGENGFEAQGDHFPTPPPVPEAIVKALQLQRAAGKL